MSGHMSPRRFCAAPGCGELVTRGRCDSHARAQTQHHGRFQVGATSYKSTAWRQARAAFLRQPENVLCVDCKANGRTTAANTVDHTVPHRGDPALFWSRANWAARCASCHSKRTAQQTLSGRRGRQGGPTIWVRPSALERPRKDARSAIKSSSGGPTSCLG